MRTHTRIVSPQYSCVCACVALFPFTFNPFCSFRIHSYSTFAGGWKDQLVDYLPPRSFSFPHLSSVDLSRVSKFSSKVTTTKNWFDAHFDHSATSRSFKNFFGRCRRCSSSRVCVCAPWPMHCISDEQEGDRWMSQTGHTEIQNLCAHTFDPYSTVCVSLITWKNVGLHTSTIKVFNQKKSDLYFFASCVWEFCKVCGVFTCFACVYLNVDDCLLSSDWLMIFFLLIFFLPTHQPFTG